MHGLNCQQQQQQLQVSCHVVNVTNGQGGCEQTKHQEWLCTGLVLHIVGDGVWDQVLGLEEHLQQQTADTMTSPLSVWIKLPTLHTETYMRNINVAC